MIAAALLRRLSRLGRRNAAPRRLAAVGSIGASSERSEGGTNSARIGPPTAEEMPATSAPTMVVAPVVLASLCSRKSKRQAT